jgi:hypothetical protein
MESDSPLVDNTWGRKQFRHPEVTETLVDFACKWQEVVKNFVLSGFCATAINEMRGVAEERVVCEC